MTVEERRRDLHKKGSTFAVFINLSKKKFIFSSKIDQNFSIKSFQCQLNNVSTITVSKVFFYLNALVISFSFQLFYIYKAISVITSAENTTNSPQVLVKFLQCSIKLRRIVLNLLLLWLLRAPLKLEWKVPQNLL